MIDPTQQSNGTLLAKTLAHPRHLPSFTLGEWDTLIRQARKADLLSRLAALAETHRIWGALPEAPRQHLLAAATLVRAQHEEVHREVRWMMQALAALNVPVVLLKGGAYVMGGLAAAPGRTLTDIDILVPKAAIAEVEAQLMLGGWHTTHHDAYDQRYYRQWMHELPPMMHLRRGTVLDVHHAILPLTARYRPDSALLLASAVPLPDHPNLMVLSATDRVLHAITHLLCNEELSHGLRDLSDIDLLLRAELGDEGFWNRLLQRAQALDLERPLAHGLRHAHALLGTPVPTEVLEEAAQQAGLRGMVGKAVEGLMHRLWQHGLDSHHGTARRPGCSLALSALYLRAHALRMPPMLLTRHLSVKAWRRIWPQEPKRAEAT